MTTHDISIDGQRGLYLIAGSSRKGRSWMKRHLDVQPWQKGEDSVPCEGTGRAQNIAEGAARANLVVFVNGQHFTA